METPTTVGTRIASARITDARRPSNGNRLHYESRRTSRRCNPVRNTKGTQVGVRTVYDPPPWSSPPRLWLGRRHCRKPSRPLPASQAWQPRGESPCPLVMMSHDTKPERHHRDCAPRTATRLHQDAIALATGQGVNFRDVFRTCTYLAARFVHTRSGWVHVSRGGACFESTSPQRILPVLMSRPRPTRCGSCC
jgi:hypothetical protein